MNKKHFYATVILLLFLAIGIQPTRAIDIPTDTSVGTWDSVNRIYTLTSNVTEGLVITEDNLTLDGAGHEVTGTGTGISLPGINYVTVKNVGVSGFVTGIRLDISHHNILMCNTTSDNQNGILLLSSDYNNLISNTISSNSNEGIGLHTATWNIIKHNTIQSNTIGVLIAETSLDNEVYNNNFLGNYCQAYVSASSGNVFDDGDPALGFKGGNHWSGHTDPDANGDGIVDDPYVFTGGQDNFPWVLPNGWPPPTPEEAIEELIVKVEDINVEYGISNSLDAKLQNALDALEAKNAGQRQDAINKMEAFINAVEAQRDNKIPGSVADELIADANYIISLL